MKINMYNASEINDAKLEGFIAHCKQRISEGGKYITEDDLIEYRAVFDWLNQLHNWRVHGKAMGKTPFKRKSPLKRVASYCCNKFVNMLID